MTKYSVIFIMLLTGCSSNPPAMDSKTQIVKVPVPVPCKINAPAKPVALVKNLKKEDPLDTKVAAVAAENERRKAYEKELEAAIKECQ